MFGAKGYRARENAAKVRKSRQLVSDEVRAERFAVLQAAAAAADVEYVTSAVAVPAETEIPDTSAADAAAAEAAAAEVAAAEKAAAEKAATEAAKKAAKKNGKKD